VPPAGIVAQKAVPPAGIAAQQAVPPAGIVAEGGEGAKAVGGGEGGLEGEEGGVATEGLHRDRVEQGEAVHQKGLRIEGGSEKKGGG
jgi:hypothetical protein